MELNDERRRWLANMLDKNEWKRADRFRFKKDRLHFIAARGQLKWLLSQYLNRSPEDVQFEYNAYGKPYLASGAVFFNISHSHQMGLIAVHKTGKIGVDIEWKRPDFEAIKLAHRFFSEYEYRSLLELPEEQQRDGFFNCWARKESFIKAVGLGLSLPLKSFDVSLKPNCEAALLQVRHNDYNKNDWQLFAIPADSHYAAAAVAKKPIAGITFYDLTEAHLAALSI